MPFPKIGDTIDTEKAIELCEFFRFGKLTEYIENNQGCFKPWIFDGASMIPDDIFAEVFSVPNFTKIALKHDLHYAYGEPGNTKSRLLADLMFYSDLIIDNCPPELAHTMFLAVRVAGCEEAMLSFSWGFARK